MIVRTGKNSKLFIALLAVFCAFVMTVLIIQSTPMKASADTTTGVNYYTVSLSNYKAGKLEYTLGGSRVIKTDGTAEDMGNPYTEYGLLGHYFSGWYTDEELTTLYDFKTQATPGLILYAGLEETSSVNFSQAASMPSVSAGSQVDIQGFTLYVANGSASKNSNLEIKKSMSIAFSILKEQNVTITFENGGSREIVFGVDAVNDNKYTSENFDQYSQVLKTASVGKGTMTVYGLQPGRYKFSYSGTSTIKVSSVTMSTPEYKLVNFVDYKRPAIPTQSVVAGDVAKQPEHVEVKGHTFLGWYTADDVIYNFENAVTTDITLTAKYQVNTYTVTFAEEGYDAISGQFGLALEEPTKPVKSGFEFAGWFQDEQLTKPFDFKTDTLQGDMTLYASFKEEVKNQTWLDSTFENLGLPGLAPFVQIFILLVVVIVIVKVIRGK